jgi:hypothetical protein
MASDVAPGGSQMPVDDEAADNQKTIDEVW